MMVVVIQVVVVVVFDFAFHPSRLTHLADLDWSWSFVGTMPSILGGCAYWCFSSGPRLTASPHRQRSVWSPAVLSLLQRDVSHT